MKKLLFAVLFMPLMAFGQTYPSPTFNSLILQNPLAQASGGTGTTTATGTGSAVLSNSPALVSPALGTPSSVTLTNGTGLPVSGIAATAANTVLANATNSVASPTAFAMTPCSTATKALIWTTGSGFGCNAAINAATLNGTTFAAPGPIGSTTPGSGAFTALSASTTNPSLTYTNGGTGATARPYAAKFGERVSVLDFGSSTTCNGSGNDGAAFTNALVAAKSIHVPSGAACVISSNLTLAAGTEIYIDAGASISVNSGITLTIRGIVHAPMTQVFAGSGTVTGIGEVWPEWWGATGTGSAHNDASAIQAAENSIEAAGNTSDGSRIVHFRPVSYGVGSTITITPQTTEKITWTGAGSSSGQTNFLGLATFTGTPVIQLAGSGTETGFEIKGFSVSPQTVGSGPTQGIRFGSSPTSWLIGGKTPALVSDLYVVDFNADYSIQDARMLLFTSVAGWCVSNATCTPLSITNSASASSFTGDTTFVSGQFVAPSGTTTQFSILMNSTTSGALVAGVRFIGTDIYYGGASITASSSGGIQDIWFESGFQLDQTTHYGLNIGSSSSATVADIHVDNSYILGLSTNATPLLNIFSSSSTTNNIFVNGNIFAGFNSSSSPFAVTSTGTLNFSGNKIRNVTYSGGVVFSITGSSQFQINDNTIFNSTYAYFVQVAASQDYYTVRSNMCGGGFTTACVNNAAAGAHSTVDANW